MDLIDELKEDHRRFLAELDELAAIAENFGRRGLTEDPALAGSRQAARILRRLSAAMGPHRREERRLLYPSLRQQAPQGASVLREIEAQDARLERLLAEAQSRLPWAARRSARRFVAILKPVVEAGRRQLLREEEEVFPLAEAVLSARELERLAQQEEAEEFPDFVDSGGGN